KRAFLADRRASLAKLLLPYVRRRLTQQFVVQTWVAALNADPLLVEAFVTQPALLNDPSLPAAPLVEAFAGAAEGGLDARFFDADGTPLDPTPARLQTADTTGARPAAATSVRLEGYFEVVRPGPHRLFVRLDKKAARATLRVGTLVDPVVDASAAEDGA